MLHSGKAALSRLLAAPKNALLRSHGNHRGVFDANPCPIGWTSGRDAGRENHVMPDRTDAGVYLHSLVGKTISTVAGEPNTVLDVIAGTVLVATGKSPQGTPVPIEDVQVGLDLLLEHGEVRVHPSVLKYRSAFVGAVLASLPNARSELHPARVILEDREGPARNDVAGPTALASGTSLRLNEWWTDSDEERFWLEITGRPDIGTNLNAPQRDASDRETPGYSLIYAVQPGDLVFHYRKQDQAITAWSRAVGEVYESPVVWLSHKASTRRRLRTASKKPGWWLDLEGPFLLDEPAGLADLRSRSREIKQIYDELRVQHHGALYFPFTWHHEALRPMQPYLNKLPLGVIDLFPQLQGAIRLTRSSSHRSVGLEATLGLGYREATPSPTGSPRQPFSVDPAILERGLHGHAETQNALAEVVRQSGLEPRSPRPDEPNFDLAWEAGGTVIVAEVKSLTVSNEERQLRLGLGQVLRYRDILTRNEDRTVVAVLAAEREPSDQSWRALCERLDVTLAWPGTFADTVSAVTI